VETDLELHRSRDLLDVVLEHAPGFIIALDEEGRIQFINRVLPQHDRKDVIGSHWLQYMPPDQHDSLRTWFGAALATGASQTYETSVFGPKGDKIWLTTHMSPMRRGNRVVGVVVVAQEITELRRTQLEFAAAQRMAAVGSLAAGIAHEINTPVQFVGDSLQFLHEGMTDLVAVVDALQDVCGVAARESPSAAMSDALARVSDAEANADLPYLRDNLAPSFDRCLEGLGRIASIVSSIREFAHPAQKEMAPADLNRAIGNTLAIARGEYRDVADLETELGEIPKVTCHVDQINQVVLNLVINAAHAIADVVKSSSTKGHLTVRTRADGDDVATLQTRACAPARSATGASSRIPPRGSGYTTRQAPSRS
jgi:PAS domain S-box-containing protein